MSVLAEFLLQVASGVIGIAAGALIFHGDVVASEWAKLRAWWRK